MVPEIWCATKTDDGWTEKATQVGAPLKKSEKPYLQNSRKPHTIKTDRWKDYTCLKIK